MMEMKAGGSAELTASENGDYMLPFLGEIRELIDENEELFFCKTNLIKYIPSSTYTIGADSFKFLSITYSG